MEMMSEQQYREICEAIEASNNEVFGLQVNDLSDDVEIGLLMRLARRLSNDFEVSAQWTLFTCLDCGRTNAILEIVRDE